MEKVNVSLIEQETDIVIDPMTKRATVYSCIPTTIKKLYKMVEEHKEVKVELDNNYGLMISVPQKWVKVSPPRKMSEEQRAAAAERLREIKKRGETKGP